MPSIWIEITSRKDAFRIGGNFQRINGREAKTATFINLNLNVFLPTSTQSLKVILSLICAHESSVEGNVYYLLR